MDIEYINITTYKGISSNADHFYATIGSIGYLQENLIVDFACKPESGVMFSTLDELRYYPSKKEAEELWMKDYGWDVKSNDKVHHDFYIQDVVEKGTIRFPSVLSIVQTVRKKYPNSVLCFLFQGSRKAFIEKFVEPFSERPNELVKELISIMEQHQKN